jgi:PIN domain nuclease of toxin-antitoxin system
MNCGYPRLVFGELIVLRRKGRLSEPQDISAWVAASVRDLELTEAPLTIEVALAIPSLDFRHGDPADHLIAASAKVFDLTLVTADQDLIRPRGVQVLANQ